MNLLGFVCLSVIFYVHCAPIEDTENNIEKEEEIEHLAAEDNPSSSVGTNPIQEWFESASKNATQNGEKAMSTLGDWFAKLAQASSANPVSQNLPTMYMGGFQLLKMPMPQMTDIIKGMGDLSTFAQNMNKVTGGAGLSQGLQLLGKK